jgi:trigger factor
MNLSVRAVGPWQHQLDIEVPVEEVERRIEEVARQIQRRASLPGFRRGRVPLEMVRQHFADAVEQQFLESFVPQVTTEAVDQARLSPVVPALVRNLSFSPGQPLRFEAVVDVKPEVEARDYRGLPAPRRLRPVDEAAVERVIRDLLDESAVFIDLDRPAQRGDVVLLDSSRLDANGRRLSGSRAKARRIELGAPGLLPDLENGLLGAVAGQERVVDVSYPADHPVEELRGKTARYAIQIRKIQEKKLRDLDDNLAREVFKLDTLEELRSRIRLNLEGEERVRVQRELENAISDELVRRHSIELPERWVEWVLDRVVDEAAGGRPMNDALKQELKTRYRPGVEQSLKREALLDAVARQEKIEVTEDEVTAELQRMTQADPRQASRIRARYQSAERRQSLRESLRERKALDWLINSADVRDEVAGATPLVVPAGR